MSPELFEKCRKSENLYYLVSIITSILLLITLLVIFNNNILLVIIVELISIAVAFSIFMLSWNTRRNETDSFLLALGISFLITALFDTLFTFAIMDSSILHNFSYNITIQIWVAARVFQAATLLVAVLLIGRTITKKATYDALVLIPIYAAAALLLLMSIFIWQNFPACSNHGYTLFKIASEYLVALILIAATAILAGKQKMMDTTVWFYLIIASLLLIAGQLAFAISDSGVALTNFLGFCFRFVAVYFVYKAIVVVGISRPCDLLYHELGERDRALRVSEERYRTVVEDQTEFISRFLPDGTHVFVNDAYCRFFGMTRDEVMGQKMLQLVYPDDKSAVRDSFASLTPETPIITVTNRILLPNGSVRWVRWIDRAIFNASGEITEYQSVGRDITLLQQANDALTLAHRKLALLSSITRHDLINQLTALKSYTELLRNEVRDENAQAYLKKIQGIADVIEEQITFTKDYETMGVRSPEWQDVAASVSRSVLALPMRDIRMDITMRTIEVFADPLFEKVFYNLIDNALRYGGRSMTMIRIRAEESERDLILVCEDDGNGISVDDKKHLFEKGFGRHTGLGLFLVREILSITGISINETGMPGEGARFEIRVPEGAFRYTGDDTGGSSGSLTGRPA